MTHKNSNRAILFPAAVLVVLAATTGCYHHRVVAVTGDPTQTASETKTHDQFLWGLIGDPTVNVECKSHSLYDAQVSTTFLQGLATAVTLGIWAPATVDWRCATVPEKKIKVPIPGTSGHKE